MAGLEKLPHKPGKEVATVPLYPGNYGMKPIGETGWQVDIEGLGPLIITRVGRESRATLRKVSAKQQKIWGEMDSNAFISAQKLSDVEESGGEIYIAYPAEGIVGNNIYGFLVGMGSLDGNLYSEILGVDDEARGMQLSRLMKVVQAYDAFKRGVEKETLTFDPLRGINAVRNDDLGGEFDMFYYDRFGPWKSTQNGNEEELPTPRLGVKWNIRKTQQRVQEIETGFYRRPTLSDIADENHYPTATVDNIDDLVQKKVPQLKFQIPGDIDKVSAQERKEWIFAVQKVFCALLTTEYPEEDERQPVNSKKRVDEKNYTARIVSEKINDQWITYYVFKEKTGS